ncbi:hypothetical protein ACFQ10_42705 [Streptomyces indonesiensis]
MHGLGGGRAPTPRGRGCCGRRHGGAADRFGSGRAGDQTTAAAARERARRGVRRTARTDPRLLSFAKEHRTLTEDDLHKLARELVRRAVRAAGPHDPPIGPDEHDSVGQALTRTLHALGDLDMDDVHAFALGPERLAAELSRRAGPDTRRLLSDDAARFHDRLLETACVHLMRFFSRGPGSRPEPRSSRAARSGSRARNWTPSCGGCPTSAARTNSSRRSTRLTSSSATAGSPSTAWTCANRTARTGRWRPRI